eukprot:1527427-Pleurochrysis_carterae.AAC.2
MQPSAIRWVTEELFHATSVCTRRSASALRSAAAETTVWRRVGTDTHALQGPIDRPTERSWHRIGREIEKRSCSADDDDAGVGSAKRCGEQVQYVVSPGCAHNAYAGAGRRGPHFAYYGISTTHRASVSVPCACCSSLAVLHFSLSPSHTMSESDFYVRYYVGHQGKFGHEFLEFEFRSDGRLRYANNSNYKNDTMIRKEGVA